MDICINQDNTFTVFSEVILYMVHAFGIITALLVLRIPITNTIPIETEEETLVSYSFLASCDVFDRGKVGRESFST